MVYHYTIQMEVKILGIDKYMNHVNNMNNSSSQRRHNTSAEIIPNLVEGIERKLKMLSQDEHGENQLGYRCSGFEKKYQTSAEKSKPMKLTDLELSNNVDMNNSYLSNSSTSILHRINKMDDYYVGQINQLLSKIKYLEQQNESLKARNSELEESQMKYRALAQLNEEENAKLISKKIDKIKNAIICQFSKQTQFQCNKHLKEIEKFNDQIKEQKKKRKYFEEEAILLKNEKNNIQQFYKQLLNKHRQILQMDIQKNAEQSYFLHKAQKRKEKKLSKSFKNSPQQARGKRRMSKQQMVPLLAKGIQQLKQRLNL